MYLQKVICIKTLFYNPDPLVRDMDPRIRILIHTKMSWIRKAAWNTFNASILAIFFRDTLLMVLCPILVPIFFVPIFCARYS
jgi:hypothetical protein